MDAEAAGCAERLSALILLFSSSQIKDAIFSALSILFHTCACHILCQINV